MKRYFPLVLLFAASILTAGAAPRYRIKRSGRIPSRTSVSRISDNRRGIDAYSPSVIDGISWINTDYNTTEGTDFWLTYMRNSGSDKGDQHDMTLYLYVTSRQSAIVRIANPYINESPITITVFAWQQQKIQIPNHWAYIQAPNVVSDFGIHITSDVPISVYSTSHHNSGKYDGTNVIPTKGLVGSYVVQTYLQDTYSTEFALVATENQSIDIHLTETTINQDSFNSKGILDTIKISHRDTVVTLKRGQTYLYRAASSGGTIMTSLSGSTVCSDKPFALFQGGQSVKIPMDPENHIFHQAYSTDQWGKTFVVTPTRNAVYDYIRITAATDNTHVYKDGVLVATLDSRRTTTYQDTIKSAATYDDMNAFVTNTITYKPTTTVYTTDKDAACYLYATGYTINGPSLSGTQINTNSLGAPTMTPITPMEQAMHSNVFATFSDLTQDIRHYVNVVTYTSEVGNMRLDDADISSEFAVVPSDPQYSYLQKEISGSSHRLYNIGNSPESKFTARVYGLGKSSTTRESYAYAAGSRAGRSADMLINGKYTDSAEICLNESALFEPIIRYDYTDLSWAFVDSSRIKRDTSIVRSGYHYEYKTGKDEYGVTYTYQYRVYDYDTIITSHAVGKSITSTEHSPLIRFPNPGIWNVYMYVSRTTPVCNYLIRDTIYATICVHPTHSTDEFAGTGGHVDLCYGDPEFEVHINGTAYSFKADTLAAYYNGEKWKLDSVYEFVDSLTSRYGCDSIVHQYVQIHPTFERDTFVTICRNDVPYDFNEHLTGLTEERVYDDAWHTIYGCDSLLHLHLSIIDTTQVEYYDTICANKDYWWHIDRSDWTDKHFVGPNAEPHAGDILAEAGDNVDTVRLMSSNNLCFDTYILHLTVKDTFLTQLHYTTCQYVPISIPDFRTSEFEEINFDTAGRQVYTDKLLSKDGCDSIVVLTLDVHEVYHRYDTLQRVCQNLTDSFAWYYHRMIDNNSTDCKMVDISTPGIITDTLAYTTIYGCDSIYYLLLQVDSIYKKTMHVTICENESYVWNNHNGKLFAGRNASDSLLKIADQICESEVIYSSDGIHTEYRVPKVYYDSVRYPTINGCDSIYILYLTVNPSYTFYEKIDVCDSELPYHWHGQELSSAGEYRDDHLTKDALHPCDSTYILDFYT